MPKPYTIHYIMCYISNLLYYTTLYTVFCYREQNLITLINVRGYFIVDKKEKKKPKKVGTGITVTAEHRAYTFLSKSLEILFRALC